MTLVDPKGGIGFAYGEKLPSAHINTVFAQQPRALDATSGGTYTLGSALTIQGSGAVTFAGAGSVAMDRTFECSGNVTLAATSATEVENGGTLTWLGSTGLPQITSREYVYAQPLIAKPSQHVIAGYWDFSVINGTWTQTNVAAGHSLAIPLTILPYKSTLNKVRVIIDGNYGGGGNHAGLPGTMPTATLVKRTLTSNGYTNIGAAVTDTPGSFANYDTPHVIYTAYDLHDGTADQWTWTALGESIDGDKHFWVVVTGETGANSNASSLAVVGLEASFTCTKVAPG